MIHVNADQMDHARRMLSFIPGGAKSAVANAVNRSAQAARTELTRKIRDLYYIKNSDILEAAKISRAKSNQKLIQAKINVRGTRRELIQFRVSPQNYNPKNRPAFITVAVKKDGKKPLPGAFVGKGSASGKLHVLKRAGKERYPLQIKYGPSIPEMAGNPQVTDAVEKRGQEILDQRLDHEIKRLLGMET